MRKTVMPVAGLGTRFLPATKAQPKEMLTVVDRPLIQYAVEEAVAAGSDEVILVSAPSKGVILDHFRVDAALEESLAAAGKEALLEIVREVGRIATVHAVMQGEPLGVGHAILQAKDAVGDEVFGVAFPDDLILAEVPVLEQLRRIQEQYGGIVVAVERVPAERVDRYGVIDGEHVGGGVYRVNRLVEKPPIGQAPSNLAIVGRYVFAPAIFASIERTPAGAGGQTSVAARPRVGRPGWAANGFQGAAGEGRHRSRGEQDHGAARMEHLDGCCGRLLGQGPALEHRVVIQTGFQHPDGRRDSSQAERFDGLDSDGQIRLPVGIRRRQGDYHVDGLGGPDGGQGIDGR
ncbi:MAG: UTP--glucose-1-phosphate uridylyltransferase [Planctomycetes bacterium]|nr:UTP--glucose-1-phosphate uridylyltransferase [Planctomycetota bacterium]